MLLLAVPGSGKTTTLITRVAYLVYCMGIAPENILTMTYTVAASAEMRARFSAAFGEEYAKRLEERIGIPHTTITLLIFIFVRACVHFAMFGDEYYLKSQMGVLKQGVDLFLKKYNGG